MAFSLDFNQIPHAPADLVGNPHMQERLKRESMTCLSNNPKDFDALLVMGDVMAAIEQHEAARAYYLRACVADKSSVPALTSSAASCIREGKFKLAEDFSARPLL